LRRRLNKLSEEKLSQEIYAKAPIKEAALDIRVRSTAEVPKSEVEWIIDPVYPKVFRRPTKMEVKFTDAGKGVGIEQASTTMLGWAYQSEDAKQILQVRTDGFTLNRLPPYESWSPFQKEAKRLWPKYLSLVNPEEIELIGLNYVNELLMPIGEPFDHYFRTYIEVPAELPQGLNVFSLGYQISFPEDDILVHVAQSYGVPQKEGFVTVNLNVQAFKMINEPVAKITESELWEQFEKLRIAKDMTFEACITDKVREAIR
jgi:uncharacterized protein (TIGR04255 family)